MTASIYWYDLETTGTDPIRDRALQFSGVRTDYDLEPLAEPQNFLCCPGNDVIPDPDAMLVTGVLMQEVCIQGDTEKEFTRKVAAELSTPATCVAGYNNLRFDDEFVRQMFYRNFHDPYAREWRNGNSRWDVIDLFRTAYALRPEGLVWPEKEPVTGEAGIPSFRLEDLTRANDVEHHGAHDAMSDVHATIAMVRLLKTRQPQLYDYLFRLRDKQAVLQQLYPLGKFAVVHVSSMYPAARGCAAIVLPLCQHPTNSNGIICFDLATSPELLLATAMDDLARLIFTRPEQLSDAQERVALKTIHINRCPSVAPLGTLDDSAAARLGLDKALCQERMRALQRASGLVEKIQYAFSTGTGEGSGDPDLMLYSGGFFSDTDRQVMTELLHASSKELPGFNGRFQDGRLDEMLFRYRARNFISTLDAGEVKRWNTYRWANWDGGRHIAQALDKIERSKKEPGQTGEKAGRVQRDKLKVLADLESYIRQLAADQPAAQNK